MSTAEVVAAALALPRAERFRLASRLIEANDAERAADLEARARSSEMETAPERFIARESHAAFSGRLRAELRKGQPSKKHAAA